MTTKKTGKVKKLGSVKKKLRLKSNKKTILGLKEVTDENEEDRKERPYLFEKFHYRSGDIDMTLIIDNINKMMRVIDYRMQQYKKKCAIFDNIAKIKKLRKIYTLVEKQDTPSWRTVGFSKEAVLPLYFRTADAYIMSRLYSKGKPLTGGIAKMAHEKVPEFEETMSPVEEPKGFKATFVDDSQEIKELIDSIWEEISYIPFIKNAIQPHIAMRANSGRKKLWVTAEVNDAFGHAKFDIITPPTTQKEQQILTLLIIKLMQELKEHFNIVSVFTFIRIDNEKLTNIFTSAGFKNMGQLIRHTLDAKGKPHDVIVWARKLQDLDNIFDQEMALNPLDSEDDN